jgi:glucose-6-phosphate isomerase
MSWDSFKQRYYPFPDLGLALDLSRMNMPGNALDQLGTKLEKAIKEMDALEKGSIANPDENRMVGHYWLRNPSLAPTKEIAAEIDTANRAVLTFAADVHSGKVKGESGLFKNLLLVGIGGSALGPQFIAHALGHPKKDRIKPYFIDNTDPDGIDLVLAELDGKLGQTLVVVISKSGGTVETRNGMLEVQEAYKRAKLRFNLHAVAVTGVGSLLDTTAAAELWLARFPMWDWVGGRTSVTGPVGLLPAALQGVDIVSLLSGAAKMDAATRLAERDFNPAALLALAWHQATDGKGAKDMVILPYKDRLLLFSRYLQQLIMESLGKEKDLDGNRVNQGIAVYGNKGSTDQHAYVQQLRDGVANFFATFIEVLRDRQTDAYEVEPDITSGDYLQGFLLGTRDALSEAGRASLTITIDEVNASTVGSLIALYERAVGIYASLVNVNAYHQPGVEAGKKAAATAISLKLDIIRKLKEDHRKSWTAESLAEELGKQEPETVFKLLEHLAANPEKKVEKTAGDAWHNGSYRYVPTM